MSEGSVGDHRMSDGRLVYILKGTSSDEQSFYHLRSDCPCLEIFRDGSSEGRVSGVWYQAPTECFRGQDGQIHPVDTYSECPTCMPEPIARKSAFEGKSFVISWPREYRGVRWGVAHAQKSCSAVARNREDKRHRQVVIRKGRFEDSRGFVYPGTMYCSQCVDSRKTRETP